jgi:spermidine synthase
MATTIKLMLYILTFISGASIMVFELIMPRLFAPHFGTSTYVWTIIIGVVMISLSMGYYLGGRIADHRPHLSTLSLLFLCASLFGFITSLTKDMVIISTTSQYTNSIGATFQASLLLLAPFNLILGMVSPLIIKLLTKDERSVGSTAGNVYALSTLGSIAGTFGSGFWLIPHYGVSEILLVTSLTLLVCALLSAPTRLHKIALLSLGVALSIFYTHNDPSGIFKQYYENQFRVKLVTDLETKYNRVWVYDQNYNGQVERIMSDSQSTLVLNQPITATMEDRLSYYAYFNLFKGSKEVSSVLMIGGGAYTYANYLQFKYPDLKIDVVEIDPQLLTVAKQYFNFRPNKNFSNYNVDGREFLNSNTKKYDVIFLDAYQNGAATPFQLITKEAMTKIYNSLSDNGQLYLNVISSLSGKSKNLLLSEYKTVAAVFEFVDVFPVFQTDLKQHQNYVIVGKKDDDKLNHYLLGLNPPISNMKSYLGNQTILTDDHAPVEYYELQGSL